MRRTIITALVALTALGGVASADRGHRNDNHNNRNNGGVHYNRGGGWNHSGRANGGVTVREARPVYQSNYRSNYRYRPSYGYSYSRPSVRFVRRPIFVQRPVIRYHYYNYYQRPTLLVENYPARPGYFWVAGQWTWSGYEWIWQPGHYEPDPNYIDQSQYYDQGQYSNGYYDQNGNWVDTSY